MGDADINMLTMEQYMTLTRGSQAPGVVKPEIRGNVNFKIKSQFMRELREDTFSGNKNDNAHEHVERILDIDSLFNILGVTHDAVMLPVFPITLIGAAKSFGFDIVSASTSGTLPSNTVTNPKEDLKGITTRSGVAYKGPTIPITSSSPKVMECDTEVTKDMMHPTNNGTTEDVPPPVVPIVNHESISKPANAPVSASRPNQKASIPFPSRRNDERRREKANDQIEKFYEIFRDLSFEISFTDALMLMPKFASTLKTLIGNKEKLSEMARTPLNENCSAVILNKLPKKLGDPGRFLIPCEFSGINTCNALADLDFIVVDFEPDPRVPLILEMSFLKTSRALIDVYEGKITLRVGREAITFNLDQTSRYTANYDHMTANRINVIDMACEEYSQEVLGFSNVILSGNPTP
ncbi:hypothetical protein Tco_1416628 [Tanacetum coccineum]